MSAFSFLLEELVAPFSWASCGNAATSYLLAWFVGWFWFFFLVGSGGGGGLSFVSPCATLTQTTGLSQPGELHS